MEIKNFSLHKLTISDELDINVIEPDIDKRLFIVDTTALENGGKTVEDIQLEIIRNVIPHINTGDNIYVAGMPIVVNAIQIAAQIKGANVYTALTDKNRVITKFLSMMTSYNDIDRAIRFELERY